MGLGATFVVLFISSLLLTEKKSKPQTAYCSIITVYSSLALH